MMALYSLLVSLAVWVCLLPWAAVCVLLGRSTWEDLRERLGRRPAVEPKPGHRVLVHAVSAGEVNAAGSILNWLLAQAPDTEVLLSVGNQAGKESARKLVSAWPQLVGAVYLPWDRRAATRRWLERVRPDLVCVVETEIWPNLFHGCRRMGIPLYVVNGRIYRGDVTRYRLVRFFMKKVLACPDWIGVQSDSERSRFLRIGAPPGLISVIGNAKFDPVVENQAAPDSVTPDPVTPDPGGAEQGLVILAACTHNPEEKWILENYSRLRSGFPGLRLVLAPRDVGRCGRIARVVRSLGLDWRFWSETRRSPVPTDEVVLVDEMGVLNDLYALADIVFVGGSLVKRGGHNVLEAARHGKSIIIGPHYHNFADVVERFIAAQALIKLNGWEDFCPAVELLLREPPLRYRYGKAARRVCMEGGGPARRYADVLRSALQGR